MSSRPVTSRPFRYSIWVDVLADDRWTPAGGIGPDAPVASARFATKWHDGARPGATVRTADGSKLNATRLRAVISVPLLNFANVVGPDCGRHYVLASKSLDIRRVKTRISGAMVGHPFIALAGEGGEFLFAFGILLGTIDVDAYRILPIISNRNAMVGGDEFLTLAFEWDAPADQSGGVNVDFFVGLNQPTWVHALRQYSDLLAERDNVQLPHNDAAWDPVWCTWTAFPSATMNTQNVLANARHARDLGIKTIILDDGWFGPGLDDDGPTPLNMGEYYPDEKKFPDLKKLIRDMQVMGLKVLLWQAPLCVADTSKVYAPMKEYLMHFAGREFVSGNGLAQLCPANPAVRKYVCDEVQRLLIDYNADGLKLDLFNCLPAGVCECKYHEHDIHDSVKAVEKLLAEIWDRARTITPNVLIELKQDYGNTQLAQYGTMVRAGDTAYDADTNARRCFWTQAVARCVHNDYLVTSIHTDPQALSLLLIRSLTGGVPTFGLDLDRIDQSLRDVIGWWLSFYRRYRPMFMAERQPQNNDLSVWQGGTDETRWVSAIFAAAQVNIPDAPHAYLLNGTSRQSLIVNLSRPMNCHVSRHEQGHLTREHWRGVVQDGTVLSIPPGGVAEFSVIPAPVADGKRVKVLT